MSLAAENIQVSHGAQPVLDHMSLEVRAGELLVLLGPNGAGKTSLLSCLAGHLVPTAGNISLGGTSLHKIHPLQRAQKIGYLPQSGDVHWALAARTVVELGRLPHRGKFAGLSPADHAAVASALTATDTAQFSARAITELSGGERARVLLARVLAGEPAYILADEPLTHLDPAHQLDVLFLMQQAARRGIGVCLVLHDLSLAARFADRLALLHQGRVAALGTASQVLTPENLADVYGIAATVHCDGDGVAITPLARVQRQPRKDI